MTNTASVGATPPSGPALDVSSNIVNSAIPADPGVFVVKTAGVASGNTAGSTIEYTFDVTNDGNVTLDDVTVTDPKIAAVSCPTGPLAPRASTTCTGTYTLTQADVDAGIVTNTATATAAPPTGPEVTADSNTVGTPIAATPGLDLVKTGEASGQRAGSKIDFAFLVTNTGNVTLTAITINDPMVSSTTCPLTSLAPQESETCTGSYTVSQADVDAGTVHNEATAVAYPPGVDPTDAPSDAAITSVDGTDVSLTPAPGIDLVKAAGALTDPDGNGIDAGDTMAYSFTVSNTGNLTLTGISVADPLVAGVSCPQASLQPGESTICTAEYTLTQTDIDAGSVTNAASVSASVPDGSAISEGDSVTTPISQRPAISLKKQSDAVGALSVGDETHFSFVVTNTGNTTLENLLIGDPMLTAVTCPVTSLAPGESTTCVGAPYIVTSADAAAGQILNDATAQITFCPGATSDRIRAAAASTCRAVEAEASVILEVRTAVDSDLAYTGTEVGAGITYGIGILAAGVLLVVTARRRREA